MAKERETRLDLVERIRNIKSRIKEIKEELPKIDYEVTQQKSELVQVEKSVDARAETEHKNVQKTILLRGFDAKCKYTTNIMENYSTYLREVIDEVKKPQVSNIRQSINTLHDKRCKQILKQNDLLQDEDVVMETDTQISHLLVDPDTTVRALVGLTRENMSKLRKESLKTQNDDQELQYVSILHY
jgi:hypothetical protein